jgi:hypothetical protein
MQVLDAPTRRGRVRRSPTTARRGRHDATVWCSVFDRIRRSEFAGQLGALRFEVRDSVVLLQGEAAHRRDIPYLLALVWSVPGVAGVRDELTFCGEAPAEISRPSVSQATPPTRRRLNGRPHA